MNAGKTLIIGLLMVASLGAFAQHGSTASDNYFVDKKTTAATPVKNQAMTGTCWCFSATSLLESQCLLKSGKELDLSEMFTVRNIYLEKAHNYVLRQGHAQFGDGGLGQDEIRAVATYGAVPESVYSGLLPGHKMHNHSKMFNLLHKYVDSIIKTPPLADNWIDGYKKILDDNLGVPPAEFDYEGKHYTPKSFAEELLNINPDDYAYLTSFTHHPYNSSFILEVPDNFSNQSYYNVALNDLISIAEDAINKGYPVLWDADVTNHGFMQGKGFALNLDNNAKYTADEIKPDMKEMPYDAAIRQRLYENLTTQDDHLMHITGIEKTKDGKTFFIVKNSWGIIGPYNGYINVSEAYFAINTISLVIPKAGLSKALQVKL